jgi:hypothetical protein
MIRRLPRFLRLCGTLGVPSLSRSSLPRGSIIAKPLSRKTVGRQFCWSPISRFLVAVLTTPRKGNRDHPTKPDGYQRTLRSCHGILHKTNPRITGMNFKDMHLQELGPDDFVYFDAPYLSGNVKTYSPDTVDFPYLLQLLEKAKFRWLLSEYPESIYFKHLGDPCFVKDVKLLCTRDGEEQVRTECLWKNY